VGRTERGARGSVSDAPSIEFLAPRADLFDPGSERSSIEAPAEDRSVAFADVDDDAPAARWTTIGAGLGLVALIAVGVIAAAPWQHTGTSAPTASTVTPTATLPATPTSVASQQQRRTSPESDSASTVGYLLDPLLLPDGWHPLGGLSPAGGADAPSTAADASPEGWLELWATPEATRTSGSWFALQYTAASQPFARQDAARIELTGGSTLGRIGFLTETPDGVSSLSFPVGRATGTITWYGWDRSAIIDMAGSVRFARSGRPYFTDTGFESDHARLLSRSSFGTSLTQDLFMTGVLSSAHYRGATADGTEGTVDITTRRADADLDDVLSRFVVAAPLTLGDTTTMFTPIGADRVVSGDLHYPDASAPQDIHLLQWTAGAVTVQLTTTLPTATLFDSFPLGLIGPGTEGAWRRLQYSGGGDTSAGRPTVDLGSGTLPDGAAWQMNIEPARLWVNAFVTSADRSAGMVVQMDLGFRECGSAASATSTVVFCVRPAGLGAASLRIEGDWGSVDASYVPIGTDGNWVGVVQQFDQPGGFVASIIGPNGATTTALALGASGPT